MVCCGCMGLRCAILMEAVRVGAAWGGVTRLRSELGCLQDIGGKGSPTVGASGVWFGLLGVPYFTPFHFIQCSPALETPCMSLSLSVYLYNRALTLQAEERVWAVAQSLARTTGRCYMLQHSPSAALRGWLPNCGQLGQGPINLDSHGQNHYNTYNVCPMKRNDASRSGHPRLAAALWSGDTHRVMSILQHKLQADSGKCCAAGSFQYLPWHGFAVTGCGSRPSCQGHLLAWYAAGTSRLKIKNSKDELVFIVWQ